MLAPYRDAGNLKNIKRNFNKHNARACQSSECAFGRTVERFRRLKFLHVTTIEDAIRKCIVACALHNFGLIHNEDIFIESNLPEVASTSSPFNIFSDDTTGAHERDAIAEPVA